MAKSVAESLLVAVIVAVIKAVFPVVVLIQIMIMAVNARDLMNIRYLAIAVVKELLMLFWRWLSVILALDEYANVVKCYFCGG